MAKKYEEKAFAVLYCNNRRPSNFVYINGQSVRKLKLLRENREAF